MGKAGRFTHRSALVLLTAVTTLLAFSAAGAAQAGPNIRAGQHQAAASAHRTDAGVNGGRADVYMRDTLNDVGLQPHTLNPLWASPDIKVCPTSAGCAVSQNPIVGVTNYIFVTIHNPGPYGSGIDSGTLHLYRTTPGGGTTWPVDWTPIGGINATIVGGTTTVMVPWNGVPGPGHFCLLARWVSANDPMIPEGPNTALNTRNNNNIVWRNVDSVRLVPGTGTVRPFAIGNPFKEPVRSNIFFTQARGSFQNAGGRIVVDLGPELFKRWEAAGQPGDGIKPIGGTQVEIINAETACIDDILLNPAERLEFKILFMAERPSLDQFVLHVTQFGPDENGQEQVDLGGVEYQITIDEKA